MTSEQRQILVQRESERARYHLTQADEMLSLWQPTVNITHVTTLYKHCLLVM